MPAWGKLGGSHSMFGPKGVGAQKPGVSSQQGTASISSSGDPQAGGPGTGFYSSGASNKDYAGAQKSGTSGPTKSGGNSKFAAGGTHAMFGNRGSLPCKPGQSGC